MSHLQETLFFSNNIKEKTTLKADYHISFKKKNLIFWRASGDEASGQI